MKKIVSAALSLILVISVVFAVPLVFADKDADTTITNTFDEADWTPTGTNLILTKPEGSNGNSLQFNGIANNTIRYYRIFNPEKVSGNYVDFKPAVKTTYKLTFRYRTKSLDTNVLINVRGVTGSTVGDVLSRAVTVKSVLGLTDYKWDKAVAYFTTPDESLDALAVSVELNGVANAGDFNVAIDDVKLEKTAENFVLANTFEEDGVSVDTLNSGATTNYVSGTVDTRNFKYTGNTSGNMNTLRANSTLAFRAARATTDANKVYFEIYDYNKGIDTSGKIQSFVPKKNSTYTINFDYKIARSGTQSLSINVRPVIVSGEKRTLGTIIATAVDIPKNDTNHPTPAIWKTATVDVPVTEDIAGLAITVEATGTVTAYTFFDNIEVFETTSEIAEDEKVSIANTYEETGLGSISNGSGTSKLKGRYIFHLGTKSAAARDGRVLQFSAISGENNISKGNITHVEIYDPNSESFSSFKPKAGKSYRIDFDFKVKAGTTGDIAFNIRGVTNSGLGDVLANAITITKGDTNYADYTWGSASTVVTVDTELIALAISIEITTSADAVLYPYLDNINLEETVVVESPDEFKNTYEETGLGSVSNGSGTSKLKGNYIFHLGAKSAAGRDGRVLQFSAISGQNNISKGNITHVELYDPKDSSFASVKPQKNTTYKIKFDYKVKAGTSGDINFNIRGVTTNGLGSILATAVTIAKGDPVYADYIWGSALVFVRIGNEDLSALAISIETSISNNAVIYPYLDNVVVSVVPDGDTTLNCHDSTPSQVTLPNTALFSDIPIEFTGAKKFEGWYLDKNFKTPAKENVYGYTDVWAKWRSEGDKIKNTYDDNGIYFDVNDDGYISRYSDASHNNPVDGNLDYKYFAAGAVAEDEKYGNAIQLNKASIITNANPALVKIYDNNKSDKAIYKPRSNTVYKISFDIKSTVILDNDTYISVKAYNNLSNSFGKGEFLKYLYTIKDGVLVNDWTKVEGYITVPDSDYDFLGISLMTSKKSNTTGAEVWIDNIDLTEIMDTNYLFMYPENGKGNSFIPFIAGEELPTIPQFSKENYIFAGWYTDTAKTVPFTYKKMPAQNINIYAKWEEKTQTASDFKTGFETGDYDAGITPYTNTGSDNHYTNNMSAAVSLINDPGDSYKGNRYLHIINESGSSKQTMDIASFALINPDGSNYQVKAGERYRIDLALRADSYCYIVPVVTEQVPTGKLNFNNCTEVARVYYQYLWYHSIETWGEMHGYFSPSVSGKVSFLIYYTCSYADIDDLSIKVVDSSEASLVKFYNEKGTSVTSQLIGGAGEWLFTPVPTTKKGYVFDGWYDSEGNQYIKSVYPSGDLNLYPRYREAEDLSDPETFKSGTLNIDFETDSGKTQAFYQSHKNSFIENKDAIFVTDDPSGAHSGGNYLKFNNAGQWERAHYRRYRLYDSNSVGNRIYLEPYSVYRVGFWMKVDRTWAAILRLAAFDNTDAIEILSDQSVVSLTEVETEDNYGKWIYYEGDITTGSEISTLGIMLSGGFVTASIDDFTVRKLNMLSVSFDSNGGSAVESIKTLEGQQIVAPIEPEKEGYIFDGWYSDSTLTTPFDFNSTNIDNNIKLYAKWVEVKQQQYKEVTNYTTEEKIVENEISDKYLDDQLNILENDKIGKKANVVKSEVENESNLWWIVLIIAGVLLLAAAILTIILLAKKRRKTSN